MILGILFTIVVIALGLSLLDEEQMEDWEQYPEPEDYVSRDE